MVEAAPEAAAASRIAEAGTAEEIDKATTTETADMEVAISIEAVDEVKCCFDYSRRVSFARG